MSLVPRVGPSELLFAAAVVGARPRETQPAAWAERHPLAARLEDRAPDPGLVSELASLEPADLDDAALLEVVAGWERAVAWARALQAAAAAEVERRASGARLEAVADEVAARLATSRRSAEQIVDRGRALAHLPEVHDLLATGLLGVRKADVLLHETRHRSFEDAREILAHVLPTAPSRTAPQLRTAVRRAEAALDPAALRERHARARRERCVRMTPAPDAMAWVTAFLPATDAMTVMTAVDTIAASGSADDDRPVDARRADALTDVMRRVLDSGVGPDGPLPVRKARRPHLRVIVPLAHLHADDGVAELAGYGPVPTVLVRESLHDAEVVPVGVDPRTGELRVPAGAPKRGRSAGSTVPTGYRPDAALTRLVVDRDVTCTFPGCRVPSSRCDLDHIVAFDGTRPAEAQTHADNLHALCRHHHRLKTHHGWTPARDPSSGTTTWVSPLGRRYTRPPALADPGHGQPQHAAAARRATGREHREPGRPNDPGP